jgi:hypothetical protein
VHGLTFRLCRWSHGQTALAWMDPRGRQALSPSLSLLSCLSPACRTAEHQPHLHRRRLSPPTLAHQHRLLCCCLSFALPFAPRPRLFDRVSLARSPHSSTALSHSPLRRETPPPLISIFGLQFEYGDCVPRSSSTLTLFCLQFTLFTHCKRDQPATNQSPPATRTVPTTPLKVPTPPRHAKSQGNIVGPWFLHSLLESTLTSRPVHKLGPIRPPHHHGLLRTQIPFGRPLFNRS